MTLENYQMKTNLMIEFYEANDQLNEQKVSHIMKKYKVYYEIMFENEKPRFYFINTIN